MATRELMSSIGVKLREVILKERNKEIVPESITMWFKRHPDIKAELEKEIIETQLPAKEVDESIFENGTFEELPSVKNWIQEMEDRHLSLKTLKDNVGALKRLCRGFNLSEEEWSFKHPDRLTLDEARDYIRKLRKKGKGTSAVRISVRGFLLSKGIVVGKKISGEKTKSYGKFARLFIEREKVYEIFEVLKKRSYDVFALSFFKYKTATRVKASLEVRPSDIHNENSHRYVHVVDKGRHSNGREEWDKHIGKALWNVLEPYYEKARKLDTKLFSMIDYSKSCKILRKAYKEVIPELEPKITRPHHFWRHQFAQHMLRATKWNYDLVAALGGWKDTKTLKECYGMPPIEVVKQWGLEYVPQI